MMLLDSLQAVRNATPGATAVVAAGEDLTYETLWARARALAARLQAAGLGPGRLVAIYNGRTADTVAALVGVMASGAAYTVVEDDGHEAEHQRRLASLHADLVLCRRDRRSALRDLGLRCMAVDDASVPAGCAPPAPAEPSQVAYVLFTSGSTGRPKGVAVTHANIAHYTASIADTLGIRAPLRYAHVSTLAADLGNTALFLSLSTGGCLHLVDAPLRKDPAALREYLLRHAIDFVKTTPSHWSAVHPKPARAGEAPPALRYLVLGGEVLPLRLARRILLEETAQVLVNHYGPTEATVGVIANPIRGPRQLETLGGDCVPLGRPLGQTRLLVRTEAGDFRAESAAGELYIGGPSVAAGYVGDPVSTRERFVQVGSEGGRYYRTGDHVAIDEHGVVRFLGRVDRQVKVNGYRLELEHVESVMRTACGVVDAAAFLIEIRKKPRLAAAVVTRGAPDLVRLRAELPRLMPAYMVPSSITRFDGFPRNDNGKTDLKALQQELQARLASSASTDDEARPEAGPEVALRTGIRSLWRRYLPDVPFGDADSFFDLGADSLDAIQMIGDLQAAGQRIGANAFLRRPTVDGLVDAIAQGGRSPGTRLRTARCESRSFSAAQDFFLRQRLAEPHHHNQAVLLECERRVEVGILRAAVMHLMSNHDMLRAAWGKDAAGRFSRLVDPDPQAVSMSTADGDGSELALRQHIEAVSAQVQGSLCLQAGRALRVHLFKGADRPDRLLLVAHHMAVDVISWRIAVSELTRLYSDLAEGKQPVVPADPAGFWDWVAHVDRHADTLYARARPWLEAVAARRSRFSRDPLNTEGAARTLWLAFSEEETALLQRDLVSALDQPIHVVLLAALAQALHCSTGEREIAVDVESHGRAIFDEELDASRVIGWHTATYPVFVQVGGELRATVAALARTLAGIPDLGMAHGVVEKLAHASTGGTPACPVCFNYIGSVDFGHDPRFPVRNSPSSVGRARGASNARGHALKFTARIFSGRLVADLSFPATAGVDAMQGVLLAMKRELFGATARTAAPARLIEEEGTRTGVLTYCPEPLLSEGHAHGGRRYEAVLLTGATGYVGVHVLRELLQQSQAHIYCLVRAATPPAAAARLHEAFRWYFQQELPTCAGRITVLQGDVCLERFGLQAPEHAHLRGTVDAIYHFAADTRLFGPQDEFERHNVTPVRQCIEFAVRGRPKDLHCMSTLAVAGVNPRDEPVAFDEDSLDVGQEFQNFYESSKHAAEQLVRQFHLREGRGFIYRSGNISGDSRSGRFQRNAGDNRLVQLLRACAKLQALPRDLGEALVLSPIDEVARAIVAISLDGATRGGVFHVESPRELPPGRLFDAMKAKGMALAASSHASFSRLFDAARERNDHDIALARFWALRRPRNVDFSHRRTHALLARLGCSFSPLDDLWLSRLVDGLDEQGVFRSPPPEGTGPGARGPASVPP